MKFGSKMLAIGAALACAGAAQAAAPDMKVTLEPAWSSKTIGLPTIDPSIKYGPRVGYYIALRNEPTRNQRKRRLARRRRHAAGFKNAFKH